MEYKITPGNQVGRFYLDIIWDSFLASEHRQKLFHKGTKYCLISRKKCPLFPLSVFKYDIQDDLTQIKQSIELLLRIEHSPLS